MGAFSASVAPNSTDWSNFTMLSLKGLGKSLLFVQQVILRSASKHCGCRVALLVAQTNVHPAKGRIGVRGANQ